MNVIIFIADDMGWADVGYISTYPALTPWINLLAREGLVAYHYYTPSGVCSTARYGMMTGRNPAQDGLFHIIDPSAVENLKWNNIHGIPIDVPTFYSELKKLDYSTGHFGKWHMGLDPRAKHVGQYGIDEYWGWNFHPEPFTHDDLRASFRKGPEAHYGTLDDRLAVKVNDFIERKAAENRPFFVNASFFAPHAPLYPRQEYIDQHWRLAGFHARLHGEIQKPRVTAAQIYFAAITQMDDAIGSVIKKLWDLKIYDRTLLIFTADNGPAMNDAAHNSDNQWGRTGDRRGKKIMVGNGGLNVPFVVRGPGIPAKSTLRRATITGTDLLPTILSMAGGEPVPEVDGEDMSAALRGSDQERTKPIFWISVQSLPTTTHVGDRFPVLRGYFPKAGVSVYVQPDGSDLAIYDRDADPSEMRNLVTRFGPIGRGRYRARVLEWHKSLDRPRLMHGAGKLSQYPPGKFGAQRRSRLSKRYRRARRWILDSFK